MKKSASAGLKVRGEVVAAALDEDEIAVGELAFQFFHGGEVHARVLADGGVRARPGFHAHDLFGFKDAVQFTLDVLGVFCGDPSLVMMSGLMPLRIRTGGDGFDDGRLAGADRTAHADAVIFFIAYSFSKRGGGAFWNGWPDQPMNRRTCALTWLAARMSVMGA